MKKKAYSPDIGARPLRSYVHNFARQNRPYRQR
ncbi:hypothetical protein KB554_12880 [Alistipes sp. Marseille-P2263]|nr:hypothetical protein [Alistipes sp. Marseille-P2263]